MEREEAEKKLDKYVTHCTIVKTLELNGCIHAKRYVKGDPEEMKEQIISAMVNSEGEK